MISAERIAGLSPEQKRALLRELLERPGEHPLSAGQQSLWYLQQLAPATSVYNFPVALRIHSPLSQRALQQALDWLAARHSAFRTIFPLRDGLPLALVQKTAPVSMELTDASRWSDAELQDRVSKAAEAPIDLETGPVFRARLFRLSDADAVLLLLWHHIALDGWSLSLVLQELSQSYSAYAAGVEPNLPPAPAYSEFVEWQQQMLASPEGARHAEFWKKHLENAEPLNLPTDHSRPAQKSYRGGSVSFTIGEPLTAQCKALATRENTTLFTVLMAAFQLLLARLAGQDRISVSFPVSGRSENRFSGVAGYFINQVELAGTLDLGVTFRDLVGQFRANLLDVLEHQDYPLSLLLQSGKPGDASRRQFSQVMFILQKAHGYELQLPKGSYPEFELLSSGRASPTGELGGLKVEVYSLECHTAKFDLELQMIEYGGALVGWLQYNSDLFEQATAENFSKQFTTLLSSLVSNPDQLLWQAQILRDDERQKVLVDWNHTSREWPSDGSLADLFESQAKLTPEAVAAVCDDRRITFGELDRAANRVANYLQRRGARPEQIVGLCIPRSVEMLVALLGILKASCVYLPLDPANPDHRLKYMVQDSQAEFVLTCAETALRFHRWPLRQLCMDGDCAAIRHAPDTAPKRPKLDLAYVVYTSGSTGEPKGVLGTQKGALNRCRWMWERYPFTPDEVCAQQTTLGFVDAVWEIFGPLLRGVPLALVRDDEVRDPERLVASLQQHRVTRITVVPSLLRVLLNGSESLGKRLPRLRYCSCSGETLAPDLAKQFRQQAADAVLLNLYGCSEAAADSCCFEVPRELNLDRVPIGRPIANTRVFILDKYQQPVPPGAQGEICIAGDGLAAGYLNRPGLTAERFTFTQLPGAERVYRTGDLGRFRGDGNIEYMGRTDHQVKIRGNRVEIGEVEAALNSHPDVIQAALQDVLDSSGDRVLVAYVISRGQPQHGNLRSYLARRLPAYMLPSRFVELTAMPLTASGKLDRQRLSMASPRDTAVSHTAPRDEMEQRLLRIWGQTLGISHLGVEDDFFDWGGHSLLAAQLASALAKEFGQRFPVSLVFRFPTVALFAAHLRGDLGADARHNLIAIQREGLKPPLFWIPGGAGSLAFSRLRPLARLLGPDQPFYGLGTKRAQTLAEVETISQRAGEYAALIQALQPRGPYYIAGFCLGGTVAFELARQLQTSGEEVAFLAMVNTWMPARSIPARQWLAIYAERALYHLRLRQTMKNRGANGYFRSKVRSLAQELRSEIAKGNGTVEEQPAEALSDARVLEATVRAASAYVPEYFEGKLHLFLAEEPGLEGVSLRLDPRRAWRRVCRDCEVIPLLGGHDEMLDPPLVEIFGERFQRLLSSAQAGSAKTVAATDATSALPSRGSRISKASRRS